MDVGPPDPTGRPGGTAGAASPLPARGVPSGAAAAPASSLSGVSSIKIDPGLKGLPLSQGSLAAFSALISGLRAVSGGDAARRSAHPAASFRKQAEGRSAAEAEARLKRAGVLGAFLLEAGAEPDPASLVALERALCKGVRDRVVVDAGRKGGESGDGADGRERVGDREGRGSDGGGATGGGTGGSGGPGDEGDGTGAGRGDVGADARGGRGSDPRAENEAARGGTAAGLRAIDPDGIEDFVRRLFRAAGASTEPSPGSWADSIIDGRASVLDADPPSSKGATPARDVESPSDGRREGAKGAQRPSWALIPFEFEANGVVVSGFFRLLWEGTGAAVSLGAEFTANGASWSFALDGASASAEIAPPPGISAAGLGERLARAGFALEAGGGA